jgi:catechol 2,3-dioxygenase-like lactoylglutathione lyase family enzyme
MWGSPPWFIADNFSVEVRNLAAGLAWYKKKLGLHESKVNREEDSGLPFVDLQISKGDAIITLVQVEPGSTAKDTRPMLLTKNPEKARHWFSERGIAVGPMQSDSGGNQFFQFADLDGNKIEICRET